MNFLMTHMQKLGLIPLRSNNATGQPNRVTELRRTNYPHSQLVPYGVVGNIIHIRVMLSYTG